MKLYFEEPFIIKSNGDLITSFSTATVNSVIVAASELGLKVVVK